MTELHPTAERVRAAAADLGLTIEVVEHSEPTRTAEEAAAAVGCAVGQIVKSLVTMLDGAPILALVSGDLRMDPDRVASALGGTETSRADAALVREATGYAIGGIPPLGHARPLPVAMDRQLLRHESVWAAAGTPNHVFPVDPAVLAEVTGAVVADITT